MSIFHKGTACGYVIELNVFSGVPGVKPERYKEAMDVQHCALSLVGKRCFLTFDQIFFECLCVSLVNKSLF